ncbi:mechanosensitive ion channel protein MscS, partial [Xanthomonas oryzae pv. oryzae]
IDINVIYPTLEETGDHPGSVLQVPNRLFFQRTTRRWRETSGFNAH